MTTGPSERRDAFSLRLRTVVTGVLSVVFLLGGYAAFVALAALKAPPAERPQTPRVLKVDVFDVAQTDLAETIVGYGTARADREVVLSAQLAGDVVALHPQLKVGVSFRGASMTHADTRAASESTSAEPPAADAAATPGDLLVAIDPETYRQRLAQAEARLAEDAADQQLLAVQEQNVVRQLARARVDRELYSEQFARIQVLRKQNVATETEFTTARLELQRYEDALLVLENEQRLFPARRTLLERRMAAHQQDLELAQLDLRRTEVRAPFDGVLAECHVELGQHLRPGDRLLKLLDTSVVEVPVALPARDFNKVVAQLRQQIRPRVALAEHEADAPRWSGEIVRTAPDADNLTRTVQVFVRIDNHRQPTPLLPGTFVHARIAGPVLRQALVIPRDCIVQGTVFVAEEGRARRRPVIVSRTLRALAVIDSGLHAGERVILTNLDTLQEGTPVAVQTQVTLDQELSRPDPTATAALAN